ncbi:hypothetical protein [Rhodanobacter denitrificans]|uniref:Uncharacterized protein n=1 Tax=Rhodanobacter denitrificans TaxID=666685 RepID=M4NHL3_9GAMM|nr:hypothetical protein [Rhodanobacter denitrificans]AGG89143.1 hypothetical protein R2APBS1_2020 [Rhodanobacter denitrificans]UJJ52965.1 hypothetical protein LRK52_18865 [Rhodanobacter denitrificans]
MSTFYTSCPAVRRSIETFTQFILVGGETQRVEFTRPIVWIQESESQLLFLHGGEILEVGETHNDFYGYLSSMDFTEEVARLMRKFQITAESSLELVVATRVAQRPARETEECVAYNVSRSPRHKAMYAYLEDDWRQHAVEDGEERLRRLGECMLGQAHTWSSRLSPDDNAALATAFVNRWQVISDAPLRSSAA